MCMDIRICVSYVQKEDEKQKQKQKQKQKTKRKQANKNLHTNTRAFPPFALFVATFVAAVAKNRGRIMTK